MNPLAFEIFGLQIRWYGILITLGIISQSDLPGTEQKIWSHKRQFDGLRSLDNNCWYTWSKITFMFSNLGYFLETRDK
ncbi:MAG: hypothetical protein R2883_03730 [Caldisericia bacterium]